MASESKSGGTGGVGNSASARTLCTAQATQSIPIAAQRLVVLNAIEAV